MLPFKVQLSLNNSQKHGQNLSLQSTVKPKYLPIDVEFFPCIVHDSRSAFGCTLSSPQQTFCNKIKRNIGKLARSKRQNKNFTETNI